MTCKTYTPPPLCIGDFTLQNEATMAADSKTMANYAAEHIEIAGAIINVFLLKGVHAQGQLMDLTGTGTPLSSGAAAGSDVTNAFDVSSSVWRSTQTGQDVLLTPAYLGYYFGTKKSVLGLEKYNPSSSIVQHITTLKLQQGTNPQNRATQLRVERSDGSLSSQLSYTGIGNGQLTSLQPGWGSRPSTIFAVANTANSFTVMSDLLGNAGIATVGQEFKCQDAVFTILAGTTPFQPGDAFTIKLSLNWLRVDVVNVPDTANFETINVRASAPAPYWRLVPTMFNGGPTDPWEVVKLELIDYQATQLDNIQDPIFLENRDRDYATSSIPIKCSYQPLDSIGDLGKFGFSIMDQYAFTCSFARMIQQLGRPIVIGDIIEVTPEVQYDPMLRPVKKFLEVVDTSWATEGFTPQWQPLLYRFLANQVLPGQETRDIFGSPEQQSYMIDDGSFFCGVGNAATGASVQTSPLAMSETIKVEAQDIVPEVGQDATSIASGMPIVPSPNDGRDPLAGRGQSDQKDLYIEDGLPPDGLPYEEGYALPDSATTADGTYFRLNYPPELNIPPRLFRFSLAKMRWIFQENDMRGAYSSMKPSLRNALISMTAKPLNKL